MHIDLLAIGSAKNSELEAITQSYLKRLTRWRVSIHAFDVKGVSDEKLRQEREGERLIQALDAFKDKVVVILDSRGKPLTSSQFSALLVSYEERSVSRVVFVLGGAHGFAADVLVRANLILSFGPATWPHLLARLMLTEQLYRAQQIIGHHPYHQDIERS